MGERPVFFASNKIESDLNNRTLRARAANDPARALAILDLPTPPLNLVHQGVRAEVLV